MVRPFRQWRLHLWRRRLGLAASCSPPQTPAQLPRASCRPTTMLLLLLVSSQQRHLHLRQRQLGLAASCFLAQTSAQLPERCQSSARRPLLQ